MSIICKIKFYIICSDLIIESVFNEFFADILHLGSTERRTIVELALE